ncbi:MAG: methyltransferase domain-containing protein [Bacteroidales bacterium]|jgi:SAM-dependent methyltransferase|nr:methyltransferase domain-containing protein [Bacteroidales bacterium]
MKDILNKIIKYEEFDEADGIFVKKSASVSYPDDGNAACFEVEDKSFWFTHRNVIITETVKKYSPKGSVFFDVGGGNGYVSCALKNAGFETVLFEPGIEGCKNAQKRGIDHVFAALFNKEVIKMDSAENIGLFDVLEHIGDDVEYLKELYALIKEGGTLYITVPAYQFLFSREDEIAGHFRRYSINLLKEKLRAAGFEIVYDTYFFWFLPLPMLIFRKFLKRTSQNRKIAISQHSPNKFISKIINILLSFEIRAVKRRGEEYPMAALIFIGGMIMCMLGLIGEYIGRIYICINRLPQYVVKETINIALKARND